MSKKKKLMLVCHWDFMVGCKIDTNKHSWHIFPRSGNCLPISVPASILIPLISILQRATELLYLMHQSELSWCTKNSSKMTETELRPLSAKKKERGGGYWHLGAILASGMAGSICPNKSWGMSLTLSVPISSVASFSPVVGKLPLRGSRLKSYNFINSKRKWTLLP